jgi:hypothetical protein
MPLDLAIYECNVSEASPELKELHARLHPLLLFYVDAASPLQQSDETMELLLLVRRVSGVPVAVLGFLTYFRCYTQIPCVFQVLYADSLRISGITADESVAIYILLDPEFDILSFSNASFSMYDRIYTLTTSGR